MSVKHTKRYVRLLFCLLISGTFASAADAEILVRFPTGTDIAQVSKASKALERMTGVPTLGVLATPAGATPVPELPDTLADLLKTAKSAYRSLDMASAREVLVGAEEKCLASATYDICRSFLFEINMIRGMTLMAEAKAATTATQQAFRSAHLADPTRVLDPRQYPPTITRAFANACAAKASPVVKLQLRTVPAMARVALNGEVQTGVLSLSPGRHVITIRALGYQPTYRLVEVDATGKGPTELVVELTPESDVIAWKRLLQEISDPAWGGVDGEVTALLERFGIEHVILLNRTSDGAERFQVRLASAAEPGLQALPEWALVDEAPRLKTSLQNALGLEQTALTPAPSPETTGPEEDLDEDDEDEPEDEEGLDEDEDTSIRFKHTDEDEMAPENKITASRVLKSPWLWISVGIVAAIVTGVVVSTQVED